jgi:hypothetical protein
LSMTSPERDRAHFTQRAYDFNLDL